MEQALRAIARAAMLVLIACVLAAASLAQTSGSAAPSDGPVAAEEAESRATAELADVAREDARLTRELLARYSRVPALHGVEVEVNAGVATLSGEVPAEEDRQRAQALAEDVPGVVAVDNQLARDTSLSGRLRPAVNRAADTLGQLLAAVPLLLLAVLVVWIAGWAGRWLGERQVIRRVVGQQPFLAELLRQSIRVGVILLGLVWALDLLDATALVSAVLGTAGLVGIALGFALRDVVENYVAGVLLGLRQPFSQGDHVMVDGNEGKVASLTTRATTLITLDGNHLRLPNSIVFKGVILNYTRNPLRRIVFRVGVGVHEDLGKAIRLGVESLARLAGVTPQPPPLGLVLELAESSVTLEFSLWFNQDTAGYFRLRSDAIRTVKAALDAGGIDMPEPTYRVELSRRAGAPQPAESELSPAAPELALPGALQAPSVEDAVDSHLSQEEALSADSNLLRPGAPRE